ncbi:MAG TPA: hypothetical protein PKJ28_07225, partial [Bacteroidales bacterium]|nr:hypothetical protein [Bacteroidales bacterium]HPS74314.1 hypothetical protein [Bacteroidales bacterium]
LTRKRGQGGDTGKQMRTVKCENAIGWVLCTLPNAKCEVTLQIRMINLKRKMYKTFLIKYSACGAQDPNEWIDVPANYRDMDCATVNTKNFL